MANNLPAVFNGTHLDIIDHDGKRWLTAEQIGLALGYAPANARTGITNLYNRHEDEFTDEDTFAIKLMANPQGGNPTTRIFSATGCHLLSFFSNTSRAKEFRAWAKQVLNGQAAAPVAAPAIAEPSPPALDRLADNMAVMAGHMGDMAQGVKTVVTQMNATGKYMALLEANQRGHAKITREIEAQAQLLHAQGMSLSSIARLLRISKTSTWKLVNGEYPDTARMLAEPKIDVQGALERMIEAERAVIVGQAPSVEMVRQNPAH